MPARPEILLDYEIGVNRSRPLFGAERANEVWESWQGMLAIDCATQSDHMVARKKTVHSEKKRFTMEKKCTHFVIVSELCILSYNC